MPQTTERPLTRLAAPVALGIFVILIPAVIYIAVHGEEIAAHSIFKQMKEGLGLGMDAREVRFDIRGSFLIHDLTIHNPKGFPDPVFFEIPVVSVRLDPGSFLKGRGVLTHVFVSIRLMQIIRNNQGEFNIAAKTHSEGGGNRLPYPVNRLRLKIGEIIFKDYYVSAHDPVVQTFKVSIDKTYTNLDDVSQIRGLITAETVAKTTLKRFLELSPGQFLQQNVFDVATYANEAATKTVNKAQETAKGAAKGTVNILKKPFQSGGEKPGGGTPGAGETGPNKPPAGEENPGVRTKD